MHYVTALGPVLERYAGLISPRLAPFAMPDGGWQIPTAALASVLTQLRPLARLAGLPPVPDVLDTAAVSAWLEKAQVVTRPG